MFRLWGGSSYGRRYYPISQHKAFLELIRDRIAISAAAGALVRFKDQQLSVINRVQDNYIYFLSNVAQFYIRGGAGTGKTWIAMKMAQSEAYKTPKFVGIAKEKPAMEQFEDRIWLLFAGMGFNGLNAENGIEIAYDFNKKLTFRSGTT